MNKIEKTYYPRTSDFNLYGELQPASLLDICQDIAGRHSEILGCGLDEMLSRGLIWAVVRQKFNVVGCAKMREPLRVETWPLERTKICFRREYRLRDANDKLVAVGAADWVLLDSGKHTIAVVDDVYRIDGELLSERALDEKLSRIADFEADGGAYRVVPGFCEIDTNGHVNNSRYANYVINACPLRAGERISSLQMDYHREVLRGEALNIFTRRTDKVLLAKGQNESGELMFICKIEIENKDISEEQRSDDYEK